MCRQKSVLQKLPFGFFWFWLDVNTKIIRFVSDSKKDTWFGGLVIFHPGHILATARGLFPKLPGRGTDRGG